MNKRTDWAKHLTIAVAVGGWLLAFGLWFKSDYAWAEMRWQKDKVTVLEEQLETGYSILKSDLRDAQAHAYSLLRELRTCEAKEQP